MKCNKLSSYPRRGGKFCHCELPGGHRGSHQEFFRVEGIVTGGMMMWRKSLKDEVIEFLQEAGRNAKRIFFR